MPVTPGKITEETTSLPPLDQESRDLLRAIAQPPDHNNTEQIDRLARSVGNWDSLVSVAREHRVLPLAFSRLTAAGAQLPRETMALLKGAYDHNAFHCMSNASELISILRAFEVERISAMPFKGIVLAATIYPDPVARYSGDLDLLVDRQNLLRATSILLGTGYDLKTPVREDGSPALSNSYEYHLERPSDGRVVELRWRLELTQPRYRRNIGMPWVWPRRQTANIAGFEVPNMDPETTLLVLCMHGSKHVWSRLLWISDVSHLLARFPNLDWQFSIRRARKAGLWRALALGVLLANRVCNTNVPPAVLRQFEADGGAIMLATSIEANLFDNPGELPKSRIPYNVKLLGLQDRLRLLLSLNVLRPNERDINFIRLPKPLYPLYVFVRPFRMLRDKSAR